MSLCTKKSVLISSTWLEIKHGSSIGYADQSFELEAYQGDLPRYFSDVPIVDSSFRQHLINFTRTSDVCVTLTISAQKVQVSVLGHSQDPNLRSSDSVEFWSHHEKVCKEPEP